MNRVPNPLIAELVQDLAPVRPIRMVHGIALAAAAALVTLLSVELIDGLWRGIIQGRASAFFFIANGMLAILAAAAALAVVRMASPHVGNRHDGARWTTAMLALLPLAAVLTLGVSGTASQVLHDAYGLDCFVSGSAFALITAGALVLWLRQGAPVSLNSAGIYTGIAAGAVGSFAYGMACPIDDIAHVGFWHVLPVALGGFVGRFAVPPLVRW